MALKIRCFCSYKTLSEGAIVKEKDGIYYLRRVSKIQNNGDFEIFQIKLKYLSVST